MRPTRTETMLKIAEVVAERGTCDRKQVGAVIAREGRVISVGYNGAPPGLPHCNENMHGHLPFWEERVHDLQRHKGLNTLEAEDNADDFLKKVLDHEGCRNATHAEANALAFAAKYGVSTDKAQLFTTVAPCTNCARLLIAAGIDAVYYLEAYRDTSGVDLLLISGMEVQWCELAS